MRKYLIVLFMFLIGISFISADEKVVPLSRLNKPATIIVDGGQILVAEFPTIYVYSQKDFSFIKANTNARTEMIMPIINTLYAIRKSLYFFASTLPSEC